MRAVTSFALIIVVFSTTSDAQLDLLFKIVASGHEFIASGGLDTAKKALETVKSCNVIETLKKGGKIIYDNKGKIVSFGLTTYEISRWFRNDDSEKKKHEAELDAARANAERARKESELKAKIAVLETKINSDKEHSEEREKLEQKHKEDVEKLTSSHEEEKKVLQDNLDKKDRIIEEKNARINEINEERINDLKEHNRQITYFAASLLEIQREMANNHKLDGTPMNTIEDGTSNDNPDKTKKDDGRAEEL